MRRLCLLMMVLLTMCATAVAEVDLDGMSYDELVILREQVNQAILASDGWQVVIASRELGMHFPVAQKPSPDKYTWYIRDYVGKNVATIVALRDSKKLIDRSYLGGGLLIEWLTTDGAFLNIDDPEQIKQYVVIGQDIAPNTELKMIFRVDSEGKETNDVESQSFSTITLYVAKIATD